MGIRLTPRGRLLPESVGGAAGICQGVWVDWGVVQPKENGGYGCGWVVVVELPKEEGTRNN